MQLIAEYAVTKNVWRFTIRFQCAVKRKRAAASISVGIDVAEKRDSLRPVHSRYEFFNCLFLYRHFYLTP